MKSCNCTLSQTNPEACMYCPNNYEIDSTNYTSIQTAEALVLNKMGEVSIDLSYALKEEIKVLVGRDKGANDLKHIFAKYISFEILEDNFEKIAIIIPERIITINYSYFLGMFGEALIRLGKENFKKKYVFVASIFVMNKIEKHINDFEEHDYTFTLKNAGLSNENLTYSEVKKDEITLSELIKSKAFLKAFVWYNAIVISAVVLAVVLNKLI